MSLIIVGAGGFGREVLAYALDLGLSVAGFLDQRADALAAWPVDLPILGDPMHHAPAEGATYVVAIGDPGLRIRLSGALEAKGARFGSLVHPTAYVGPRARIAPGCVLGPFAFVGPDATLEPHAVLNTYASAGHDATVGAGSVLSPYAVVNGAVVLESEVLLGTHAAVLPGKRVGRRSRIAAGAVVTRDVPPGSLAVGVPAKDRVMFPVD